MIDADSWDAELQLADEPVPNAPGNGEGFVVTGLDPNAMYYFALKTADEVPNWSGMSNVASRKTDAFPDTIPPAAVSDLAAGSPSAGSVTLTWTAPADDDVDGTAAEYDIRYSTSMITDAEWASASQVSGEPAPKAAGSAETFEVGGLSENAEYFFALKAADERPNWSTLSNVPAARTLPCSQCWSPLGAGISGGANPGAYIYTIVNALTLYDNRLIAGGHFNTAGSVTANYIAAWDGSSWSSLGSGMNVGSYSGVYSLAVYNNQLIAAGNFTRAGGVSVSRIAAWDGSTWSPIGSGMTAGVPDPWVTALAAGTDLLYAGGAFTAAGGRSASRIASWRD